MFILGYNLIFYICIKWNKINLGYVMYLLFDYLSFFIRMLRSLT